MVVSRYGEGNVFGFRFGVDLVVKVVISLYNFLGGGCYYDVESLFSFDFDYII